MGDGDDKQPPSAIEQVIDFLNGKRLPNAPRSSEATAVQDLKDLFALCEQQSAKIDRQKRAFVAALRELTE